MIPAESGTLKNTGGVAEVCGGKVNLPVAGPSYYSFKGNLGVGAGVVADLAASEHYAPGRAQA